MASPPGRAALATATNRYNFAWQMLLSIYNTLALDCRWTDMVHLDMFAHIPALLPPSAPLGACPADVKIFVYPDAAPELAARPLSCYRRLNFWNTEVLFHQHLIRSRCVTTDPTVADFFFLPMYTVCRELENRGDLVATLDRYMEVLDSFPYHRQHPARHIVLHAGAEWALREYLPTRAATLRAVSLATEPNPVGPLRPWTNATGRGPEGYVDGAYVSARDLIIPPAVPLELAQRLLSLRALYPFEDRSLVAVFHGQSALSLVPRVRAKYEQFNETLRVDVIDTFSALPGFEVGGPVMAYTAMMANAKFCLCPKGITSYTARLFEAILAGCVPVILSDSYTPPFRGVLRWEEFSIKWPTARLSDLPAFLTGLLDKAPGRVTAMHRRAAEVACYFQWFPETRADVAPGGRQCGPAQETLRALARMKRRRSFQESPAELRAASEAMDRRRPRFWWPDLRAAKSVEYYVT